jgi:hypothetical protein
MQDQVKIDLDKGWNYREAARMESCSLLHTGGRDLAVKMIRSDKSSICRNVAVTGIVSGSPFCDELYTPPLYVSLAN